MKALFEHPVGGRMGQSVRVEEIVYVADASATLQSKEALTMETTASVMMNTVRSMRTSYVQVKYFLTVFLK